MAAPISSRRVLAFSLFVDLLDIATNLTVALLTGSAVIFAEMAQGLADSVGSLLLVVGERRASRPRDTAHPFGYAREAFFWGLLSAVVMLVVGVGLSAWRGYRQLVEPEPIESPSLALAVLVVSIMTNGYAVKLSARKLAAEDGSLRRALRGFDRPLVKSALLRDTIGTTTSVLGLIALLLYQALGLVAFDAVGALGAALLMCLASLVLIGQARALIVGQALAEEDLARLHRVVRETPSVEAINRLAAVFAGASTVLVDADLDLAENLDTAEIESVLDDVELRVRSVLPETERVSILLNSNDDC